jgi:hypothetical protein
MVAKVQKAPEIERSKENILKICADYGMNEKTFLEEIKKNSCNGPFKPEKWDKYLLVIRNWRLLHPMPRPKQYCAICGEEMHQDSKLVGLYKNSPMTGMRCENRHHFFMLLAADGVMKSKGITFEEAVEIVKKNDQYCDELAEKAKQNGSLEVKNAQADPA